LDVSDVEGIPETLLMSMDDEWTLSPWGQLAWDKGRDALYAQQLWSSPNPTIAFSANFERSVKGLAADRMILINHGIDQLAKHFLDSHYNPPSLTFKPLQGKPVPGSTHEFYAWSDQDAKRVFGHYEDKIFVLDELGKHL
jgi:hypothetical protein